MKKLLLLLGFAALCVGFAGCNDGENPDREPGLGEEIQGLETRYATGTIIGTYANGFGSKLVQVDEEYPIGDEIEYFDRMACTSFLEIGTYKNMIQIQGALPIYVGSRISFSYREFQRENYNDIELFTFGSGVGNAMCGPPRVPICVITDYQIIDE